MTHTLLFFWDNDEFSCQQNIVSHLENIISISCFIQASSQCSYKSSPTIPKLNNALVDLDDTRRSMSPSSQSQAPIKQELDHHMSDFHENMSLPVSKIQLFLVSLHALF